LTERTCSICKRSRPVKDCVVVELTAAEEADLVGRGVTPDDEYIYCKPCWRVIQDASNGPSLMRAAVERELLKLGVMPKRAKKLADRYHAKLIELGRRSRHPMHS